jgi:transcriptional regulator with XRE-family HTH domain
MRRVDRFRIGRLHRSLRHRARLTQEQLGETAGVAPWKIKRIEAGELDRLRLGDISSSFSALSADFEYLVRYRGAAADRLLDEGHARLVGLIVDLLKLHGWEVRIEVSYSSFGERGSIDVLAWHAAERVLVVIEVKTEFGALESTLRTFDAKVRLAPGIAAKRFAWHARSIGQMLVLPEDRTARRRVDRHATVLRMSLPAGSRELRSWVARPSGSIAGIWFLTIPGLSNVTRNPSSIRRVRHSRARSNEAASARNPGPDGPPAGPRSA